MVTLTRTRSSTLFFSGAGKSKIPLGQSRLSRDHRDSFEAAAPVARGGGYPGRDEMGFGGSSVMGGGKGGAGGRVGGGMGMGGGGGMGMGGGGFGGMSASNEVRVRVRVRVAVRVSVGTLLNACCFHDIPELGRF